MGVRSELRGDASRRRGVRAVAVLLGVSVVSGGVGWGLARNVRSPAEVAARTSAPAASRLTAPVELRVLRSTLFTRGMVRFGSPRAVTLPGSSLKTGSLVITSPPKRGVVLAEGAKAADIGGRPVVVLQGVLPMYRDVRPGDRGDDVIGLKAALRRLGFDAGAGDAFDVAAQRAVTMWMRSLGYEPFGPTEAQQVQLRTAKDAVRKADTEIVSAQGALSSGVAAPSADKILGANEEVRAAVDRAAAARTNGDRTVAQAELLVVTKRSALGWAQIAVDRAAGDLTAVLSAAEAEQSVAAAAQRIVEADAAVVKTTRAIDTAKADAIDAASAVTDAQATLDAAATAQAAAEAEVVRTKAKPAPTIPVSAGTFMIDMEAYNASVRQAEATVTSAAAQVRSASAGLRAAQRASVKAVDAIADAETTATSATAAAAQARESLRVAELRRSQSKRTGTSAGMPSGSASLDIGSSSAGTPPGAGPPNAGTATGAGASATTAPMASSSGANSALTQIAGGSSIDPNRLQVLLETARTELDQAVKAVEPTRRAADAAIRAADAQVRIAKAQRVELTRPADASTLKTALRAARMAKASAEANLVRLEASVGIVVPADEVLFFPALPLRVDESKLAAGDALSGVLMTVATQRLAVDASVDPSDATALRVGQPAEVEATDLELTVAATITRIASTPGTDGADASRIYVEVTPNEDATLTTTDQSANPDTKTPAAARSRTPTLADLNGVSVKVTVPISTTGGKVLAVPTPAVSAAADGTVRVELELAPNRPTTFVTVKVGLRADGYVQITPTVPSALKAGDLVVTGASDRSIINGTPNAGDAPAPGNTATAKSGS